MTWDYVVLFKNEIVGWSKNCHLLWYILDKISSFGGLFMQKLGQGGNWKGIGWFNKLGFADREKVTRFLGRWSPCGREIWRFAATHRRNISLILSHQMVGRGKGSLELNFWKYFMSFSWSFLSKLFNIHACFQWVSRSVYAGRGLIYGTHQESIETIGVINVEGHLINLMVHSYQTIQHSTKSSQRFESNLLWGGTY